MLTHTWKDFLHLFKRVANPLAICHRCYVLRPSSDQRGDQQAPGTGLVERGVPDFPQNVCISKAIEAFLKPVSLSGLQEDSRM